MKVHGLILAGGRGSRLGDVRKADLRIGGISLIERVATRMNSFSTPLLISTGPEVDRQWLQGLGIRDDLAEHKGPMAGILAAARHLFGAGHGEDLLVTVAVDTPFLPTDFVETLVGAIAAGHRGAYATWGSQIYPPNAAWRVAALAPLVTAPDVHSPKQAHRLIGSQAVDWAGKAPRDPFANLNTLSDLIALGQRAQLETE